MKIKINTGLCILSIVAQYLFFVVLAKLFEVHEKSVWIIIAAVCTGVFLGGIFMFYFYGKFRAPLDKESVQFLEMMGMDEKEED